MKNETDRKMFDNSGSVYSALPSVCIAQTVTSDRLAAFPCFANAVISFVGVAAAPCRKTVSPSNEIREFKHKLK